MLICHWPRWASGLVAWALASSLALAGAGAPGVPPQNGMDPDLTALLGLVHPPFRMDDPVGPDARCRNAGAGDLYERDQRIPGWEIGQYNCDDRVIFTLEHEIGAPNDSSRLRIVDGLVVPGATYSGTGRKPRVSWAVSGDGVCGYASAPQSSVIVALQWNSRHRVTARNGILKAWRFNTQSGRIEPTSTRGIVCVNPAP